MPMPKLVEVSQDALGYLLVYARNYEGHREGEPVCNSARDPEYYKTRAGAQRAAKMINDVPNPGPVQMSK
jgi:hypothetical protein